MSDGDEYRFDFPLQPETIIESAERLFNSDDPYESMLALELKDGYERCDSDLSKYRDVNLEEELEE